jgi:mono/diheme cytochrome c family protein
VFGGGFARAAGGIQLQWYANAHAWTWNISGKPTWSIPANIPIAYECAILLAVFASFFGMWILNKLPQVWHPLFRQERFTRVTDDSFFIGIEAKDKRFDSAKTKQLLIDAGAIHVEEVYLDPDPVKKTMPKWITAMIVASTAFALIPFAIAAKARNSHSAEPHIHIFPDMDFQPKYKSDTVMDVFLDGRANRGEIPGTVARDQLIEDEAYHHGLERGDDKDKWVAGFPVVYPGGKKFVVDDQLMQRGRGRYEIYCTPCHGYDGRGAGMVPERVKQSGGLWVARNLVEPPTPDGKGGVAVLMPNGQLFNTISNGYGTMMGYAAQITPADRWAIVAYVRALQRAQNASGSDVPADQQGKLR